MRIAALVLLAGRLAAQQAGIEGIVLDQASGRPLSAVHVRLFDAVALQTATQTYGAITGDNGRYSVAGMPPGNYTVELERPGYVQPPGSAGYSHATFIPLHASELVTRDLRQHAGSVRQ